MGDILPIESFAPAARDALAAFGIDAAELKPISNTENAVFRATEAGTGTLYAIRLHRPGYHRLDVLEAERHWTEQLAAAGMIVPSGRRTRDGQWYARVDTPEASEWRYAGVTLWHRGRTLESIVGDDRGPVTWPWFRRLGTLIAEMHNHSADWTPPPNFTRHRLDRDGIVGETPFWGRFWDSDCFDADERALMVEVRALVDARLVAMERDGAEFGLIHADSHAGNVLVSGERLGLIDFDDCGFGWFVHDFGVILYSAWDTPHFALVKDAFLSGYADVRTLPADIDAQLDLFLLIRSLMLAGWRADRPAIMSTTPLDAWKPALLRRVREALDRA